MEETQQHQILIVEDDEGLNYLIKKILKREGFIVKQAFNGKDAVRQARENPEMLLLLDFRLPDMFGKEVVQVLADEGVHSPFIIMTVYGDEKTAVDMMKLGAKDYIVKDSAFTEFLPSVIQRVFKEVEGERKLSDAESRAREGVELFKKAFLTSSDLIAILKLENATVKEINNEFCRFLEVERSDVLDKSFTDLGMMTKDEEYKNFIEELRSKGCVSNLEVKVRLKKEENKLILLSANLTQLDNEVHYIIIGRDITERNENEIALKKSEEKFRKLFEQSYSGIVLHRLSGGVIDVNQRMLSLGEYDREQFLQLNFSEMISAHNDQILNTFWEQLQTTGNYQFETEYIKQDQSHIDVEISSSLVDKKNGIIQSIFRDISEKKRTQEMIIQTEKMMSIGGLAAGMAHEINNPLAGILQNIQVIQKRLLESIPANERVSSELGLDFKLFQEYLEIRNIPEMINHITESGKRAAKIVDNMLSFSRKSSSKKSFYNMAELLDSTIDLASNDYDLKKKYDFKKIHIDRQYQANLPDVNCEASKIQQVFFNILKNGAEAIFSSNKEEKVFKLSINSSEKWVTVTIEDSGIGISEEIRKRIFEPFFTTKEVGVGTGLGLSISYFIITKDHAGKMEVESKVEKGTCFKIQLPIG